MSKKESKTSVHHILCKSRGGSGSDENLILLKHNYHQAIHTLFANQMIADQLITTVNISSKALREDVKQWLLEVFTSRDIDDPRERYKDECIK